jgi:hypothetical protein
MICQQSGQAELMQIILMNALTASTEAMKQILETFDVRNIDKIIVKVLDIAAQNQQQNGNNPIAQPAGNGGNSGVIQAGGIQPLTNLIPQLGSGGGPAASSVYGQ